MRVLILGGTSEASELAKRLAGDGRFEPIVSLAGRVSAPAVQAAPYRIGGFGGTQGLRDWLMRERIQAIVDATHPFAVKISEHAVGAARTARIPLMTLQRPAWVAEDGDRWIAATDMEDAAVKLGIVPARVLLTVGRQQLAAFKTAPQHHYLIRSIDAPDERSLPPIATLLLQRGPFDADGETRLMKDNSIDIVVTKNSGAAAIAAKLAAARALKLPVVMVARPHKPAGEPATGIETVLAWLGRLERDQPGSLSERAV